LGIVTSRSETAFNRRPEILYDFVADRANRTKTYPGSAHIDKSAKVDTYDAVIPRELEVLDVGDR
jgi:hypothetical protein